jgi:hypothetical protein
MRGEYGTEGRWHIASSPTFTCRTYSRVVVAPLCGLMSQGQGSSESLDGTPIWSIDTSSLASAIDDVAPKGAVQTEGRPKTRHL